MLTFLLFVGALYDMLFARRADGDPTMSSRDPAGTDAMTYNNPGFRDKRSSHPGVYLTSSSSLPYHPFKGGTTLYSLFPPQPAALRSSALLSMCTTSQ